MEKQFYYVGDRKVELTPAKDHIAVQLQPDAGGETVMATIESAAGTREAVASEVIDKLGIVIIPTADGASPQAVGAATRSLNQLDTVVDTLPVFEVPDGAPGELMVLTPDLLVQFKPDASAQAIAKLNRKHKVQAETQEDLGPNTYLLKAKPGTDTLALAQAYHESDLTEAVEPDFVMKLNRLAPPVNDPIYPSQWGLDKIQAPQAWHIHRGRSNIKIAIVDEGVQTSHEDLASKIVTPYDAVDNNNNQEPLPWDGHGTACAGIAAATTNNRTGVAGVAQGCKIMPIRIAYSAYSGAGWTTRTSWIVRGLRTAVNRGADVLSNSWGGGPYSASIRSALQHARTNGRGGKGAVVVSATGNDDQRNVSYPAKYPESLACGASNQWDQRKSRSSRDGEHWWGSNYGPEVDFVAPGVKIPTTDIMGAAGYGSGNYIPNFNGTSSATPHAAGIAALVLSVDPTLRQWEVRDLMRLTARDLGAGGKDDHFGWGRLDAARALQAARKLWYSVRLRPEFLGTGQECFMRFQVFRLFNSGLNRVRVNRFTLRSFNPQGREIDRFTYTANPGGIMAPGLSAGGGSRHDLRFENLLLKAHGNRRNWRYSYRADWNFTYWRPGAAATNPALAMEGDAETESLGVDQDFSITIESPGDNGQAPVDPQVEMREAYVEEEVPQNGTAEPVKTERPFKVVFEVE